jgi:hypothetical protein
VATVVYYGRTALHLGENWKDYELRAGDATQAVVKGQLKGGMGLRIENPHLIEFLLALLTKKAGGTEACGQPVFRDTGDPDYRAVLKTFAPVAQFMAQRPRMDMPNPAPSSCPTVAPVLL